MTNLHRIFRALNDSAKTCDQVEQATGLAHQVVSARIRDLAKRKRIHRTGQRRMTRLGRMAWVWAAQGKNP